MVFLVEFKFFAFFSQGGQSKQLSVGHLQAALERRSVKILFSLEMRNSLTQLHFVPSRYAKCLFFSPKMCS